MNIVELLNANYKIDFVGFKTKKKKKKYNNTLIGTILHNVKNAVNFKAYNVLLFFFYIILFYGKKYLRKQKIS